jgi:hypothetical protein
MAISLKILAGPVTIRGHILSAAILAACLTKGSVQFVVLKRVFS